MSEVIETASVKDMTQEDIILSSILDSDSDTSYRRRADLVKELKEIDMFSNGYFIMALLSKEHPNVTPDEGFIKLYLKTNRSKLSNTPQIDLLSYKVGENDEYVEFLNQTVELYKNASKYRISDSDFYRAIEMIKMTYTTEKSITVLEESAAILTEGLSIKGKSRAGFSDMREHVITGINKLSSVLEKEERKGAIIYGINDTDEVESGSIKLVSKFGIEALDEEIGGIYEGDMVSLLAPAKGGKSRGATFMLHTALVEHGQNILMWSIENGYKGWEALLRARHFEWLYNSKQTDLTQRIFIDADMIRKGEYPSKQIEEMELASWADLRSNKAYGRIANMDESFEFETCIQITEDAIKRSGAKLICIDYLQLVSGGKGVSKNERIGEIYKMFLQLVKRLRVGGIFPAQIKQSMVSNINNSEDSELINMELRDAAGESYEVIKTPDVNLMFFSTTENLRDGEMKILSIPSRNSKPFEPINLRVNLGTCTFTSLPR